MDQPMYFQDDHDSGIFRFMQHDHWFRSVSSAETEMRDVFCFAAPLLVVGRNAVLKQIAESSEWRQYLPAGA